jgi:glucarate dehydratase
VESPPIDHVPMSAYTWYRFPDINGENEVTFDTYPEHVQELIREHGFQNIKLSTCDFEPHRYVELVHRIRAAVGPDVDIRVDPHASWGEAQALRFVKEVEDCHIEWIEEPVGGSFDNIWRAGTRLRQHSIVPVSSHAWLPPVLKVPDAQGRYGDATLDAPLDLKAMRRYQPADISAPDAYAGPLALKRHYDTARFMGMGIGMHSAYELGPSTAIRLHIAAFAFPYEIPYHIVWGGRTAPFSLHPLDAHYNQWEGDVIRGGKMVYDQGFLPVPDGPGLGVELDPERLAHYAFTQEKAAVHTRHIEKIRAEHLDTLGWRVDRTGWPRYRSSSDAQ